MPYRVGSSKIERSGLLIWGKKKITIPPTKKIVALTYVVLNSLLKRMGVFAVEKREGKGSKIR